MHSYRQPFFCFFFVVVVVMHAELDYLLCVLIVRRRKSTFQAQLEDMVE